LKRLHKTLHYYLFPRRHSALLVAIITLFAVRPLISADGAGAAESEPWPDPKTVASGITVPKALGDFLVLDAVRATGGTAIAVTDDDLLAAQQALARDAGRAAERLRARTA